MTLNEFRGTHIYFFCKGTFGLFPGFLAILNSVALKTSLGTYCESVLGNYIQRWNN